MNVVRKSVQMDITTKQKLYIGQKTQITQDWRLFLRASHPKKKGKKRRLCYQRQKKQDLDLRTKHRCLAREINSRSFTASKRLAGTVFHLQKQFFDSQRPTVQLSLNPTWTGTPLFLLLDQKISVPFCLLPSSVHSCSVWTF